MMNPNTKVDAYIHQSDQWSKEIERVRRILDETSVEEDFKWGAPCYTAENAVIATLNRFKDYLGLGFWKGVFLSDEQHLLERHGEHSQSVRVLKLRSLEDIERLEVDIRRFIDEAIQVEKAGFKVDKSEKESIPIPSELEDAFRDNAGLQEAFESLSPGRQRAYLIFFTGAKQSQTRRSRIDKHIDRILDGLGMNDY